MSMIQSWFDAPGLVGLESRRVRTQNTGPVAMGAGTNAQEDAFAYVRGILDEYGLGQLADLAWEYVRQDYSATLVVQKLSETAEFKTRFKVIEQRKAAGLPPISPAEVVTYERNSRAIAKAAGFPPDMIDTDELLLNDVSAAELGRRINDGWLRVSQAPAEVRSFFNTTFGVDGDAALAAFFTDSEKATPMILRAVDQAQMGGTAARFGIRLTADRAERLVGVGVTAGQANTGFSELARDAALFEELAGESDLSAEGVGVDAAFGLSPTAQTELERRRQERLALTGGSTGSGAAETRTGTALGTSERQ